jgi:hypothetical protein
MGMDGFMLSSLWLPEPRPPNLGNDFQDTLTSDSCVLQIPKSGSGGREEEEEPLEEGVPDPIVYKSPSNTDEM